MNQNKEAVGLAPGPVHQEHICCTDKKAGSLVNGISVKYMAMYRRPTLHLPST